MQRWIDDIIEEAARACISELEKESIFPFSLRDWAEERGYPQPSQSTLHATYIKAFEYRKRSMRNIP